MAQITESLKPEPAPGRAGIRAAVLLVLWYGLRGVGGALGAGDIRRSAIIVAEYAAFVVIAAGALRWVVLNS